VKAGLCSYGTLMVLRGGIVAQALGMAVHEYCIVMPKYVECVRETPWIAPWGARLCRVIRGYGPLGLGAAVRASGVKTRFSPYHGAQVPVAHPWDVELYMAPPIALKEAVRRGELDVVEVLYSLLDLGVSITELGLTGSRALSYSHALSDVDLVVYGPNAEVMYEVFKSMGKVWDPAGKSDLGGVTIEPRADLSWRRRVIGPRRTRATWIGAPVRPLEHCPPLRRQETGPDPPAKPVRTLTRIEPGQLGALMYPPCVKTSEGEWVVSYEYNVAGVLYKGGRLEISGLASDGDIIFLGLREYPGALKIYEEKDAT